MSAPRTSRSPDLQRLVDDGYELAIVAGYLVVRDVPYVDRYRRVRRGQLVSTLDLAGDRTIAPRDHQAWFAGALPCDREGRPLVNMVHAREQRRDLGGGLLVDHWLCSKPIGREFVDYHEKMVTFVHQISSHAVALDPSATARTGRIVAADGSESPFHYVDTATSRSGIGNLSDRLAGQVIGIVGLGGTGGYVLDFLSKTPVARIHLFDDDLFLQHNAFRAPGAVPLAALAERRAKVDHFDRIYSALHRGVVPHRVRMGPATMRLLDNLDFVFLCSDDPTGKRQLVERLEDRGISFIDVGMGLQAGEHGLTGIVRTTASTPAMRDHVWDRSRIPMAADDGVDPYATNIQVVELNALNAALAIIRWKRLSGFYVDTEAEHFSTYAIDGNHITNGDQA
ncbi:ThiF family adenylyltransferase [Sphingomonas sp.]|uniref:ThiF family adenylyltransferase n=1 Tax=Sphingomonas sp. TaxID=28214 RepID=UPI00179B0897|nr:ThiF family adenylyltransferase [Sphingomonas sp.]MBA4760623.1 ThiF family adenylyltransferase [Sphingomonas sp.]